MTTACGEPMKVLDANFLIHPEAQKVVNVEEYRN